MFTLLFNNSDPSTGSNGSSVSYVFILQAALQK